MSSERIKTTLGQVLELKRGYDLPTTKREEGDYPIVSSSGVSGSHSEAKAQAPGVVTGRYGTIGELFYLKQDYWPLNTALYVRDFKGNLPRFIYYFLHSVMFAQFSDKSSVPGVNRNHLHAIEVDFEKDLNTQRAIAKILGDLDDKIDLIREINRTLEEITRTMFRSWFVDFEPVRAKAAGSTSYRGMPQNLFDQLPDSFNRSDVGEIPTGWTVRRLEEILEHPKRAANPNEIAHSTPYIGLEHMPRRSITLDEWETAEKVTSNKHKFEKFEILFGKLRPNFHKVGVAFIDGVCSTDIVVLRPRKPEYFGVGLMCASSDEFVAHNVVASSGTKMPRTNWDIMARYQLALPKLAGGLISSFDSLIRSLVNQLEANTLEVNYLASMRDALLPELVSGKLPAPSLEALGLAPLVGAES